MKRKNDAAPTTGKPKNPIYKRWWFWVIIVFIGLAAYGSTLTVSPTPTPTPTLATEQHNVLMDSSVHVFDILNGLGTSVIGQRAYISVPKSDLSGVSQEEFSEFVNSRVADSGYNYWTIVCDDGTGLFFAGSIKEIVEYGTLDTDGMIESNIGYAALDAQGQYTYAPSDVAGVYTREEVSEIVTNSIPNEYQVDSWFSVDVLSQTDNTYTVMVQYDIGSNDTSLAESSAQAIFDACYPDLSKNGSVSSISFMIVNGGAMVSMFDLPEA